VKLNTAGYDLIKQFEGCKLIAYKCPAGIWTIGYGHTKDVKQGDKISQHQADILLGSDVEIFENYVSDLIKGCECTQNQFNALVSFAFNLGNGNLKTSTLMRKFKAKEYDAAAKEFLRWNIAGGKGLDGLTRRRNAEMNMFLKK